VKSFDTRLEPLSYKDEALPEHVLKQLALDSTILPCAFYLQPTHIYIAQSADVKDKLFEAAFKQPLVKQAPAIIVFTGDRFVAKGQDAALDEELAVGNITVDEAERARQAAKLHFDVSPLGMGWLGKLVAAPIMHIFTTMPQLPAIHKREFLTRQVMRSFMTLFWQAHSMGLSPKIVDSYDEWRIKRALNIPWHQIVVSCMLLGYAKSEEKKRNSVTLDENTSLL